MPKKEKHGDWDMELDVLSKEEAMAIAHDPVPAPSPLDKKLLREQKKKDKDHPVNKYRLDDSDLD